MKLNQRIGFVLVNVLTLVSVLSLDVLAMASRPADPTAPPPPAWVSVVPMIVMIAVFYFILIRPQSKQRQEKQNLLNNLKKGDRIVTHGGFYAQILNISGQILEVKLNEETRVKIQKSAVAEILQDQSEPSLVHTNGTQS